MWELIHANKRNSIILMASMALCLLALGFVIGSAVEPGRGGSMGLIIAAAVWLVLALISLSAGDQILLAASSAQKVTHDVHPQLFNVVEEMTIAANIGKVPDIYIINDPAPNAFATGRSPKSASIAVTAGLLGRLNRDELQGVIGHEMSHILNRDVLFVTLAGIMLGAIVLISEVFLRGLYCGGASRRRYSSRDGGGYAQLIMMIAAIAAAILAPLFAQILYFALSRKREYLADASSVRLTRYPEGLASALEKISSGGTRLATANKVTAPMYIVNPLTTGSVKAVSLMSTHPPIEDRIRILRNMSHGASYIDYARSYEAVTKSRGIIPAYELKKDEKVELRTSAPAAEASPRDQKRQLGDVMAKVSNFAFLACPCGLKIKIPPAFKGKQIECPRCARSLLISQMSTLAENPLRKTLANT
jgi:heat shock protein HtpX